MNTKILCFLDRVRHFRVLKWFAIFLFFGIVNSTSISFAAKDTIVAVVNDELITYSDLIFYVQTTYASIVAQNRFNNQQLESIKKDLEQNGLTKLIDDKLILSEANKLGIKVRPKDIEGKFNETKDRYETEDEFMQAIISTGTSITDLKKRIEDQLKISYAIDIEIRSKIVVNPQEVTDYYNAHIADFQTKEKADVQSIFISVKNKEKLDEVMNLLKNNGDFVEISKKYSDSPSISTVERGQLMPNIENSIFSLVDNQVSSPLEVESGYFIFKLLQKVPAQTVSLQDAKQTVNNIIFQQKFMDGLAKWIEKLHKNSYVEIKK